ncbi:MAG: CarD family transcriptional regulator, partial [Rhodocyclaceae bacterium]
ALARLAGRGRMLTVVAASPLDAQRLREEIAWFAPALRVFLLPDWETLPYDSFSPHHDLISERLAALYEISRGACDVALMAATTALYRLPPAQYLAAFTFFVKQKAKLESEALRSQLVFAGYQHVTQVVSPGEFSVRGGLIDLFPMGSALPYRIELFDDEVDTIRTFDVDTQRTLYPVAEIRMLPAREFPLDEGGRTKFRSRFRETFEGDPSRCAIYKDVSAGTLPPGIEYYLPLFFDETATIFDYLPRDAVLCQHRDVPQAIEEFWRDTRHRYKLLGGDRTRPVLPPQDLFLDDETFFIAARAYGRLNVPAGESVGAETAVRRLPDVKVERRAENPLHRLEDFVAAFPGRTLITAESPGRRETMLEYFREHGLQPAPCADFAAFVGSGERQMLAVAPLAGGFVLAESGFAVITENELYATTARPRGQRQETRRATVEGWLRDLTELRTGDPVVHLQHGIGRYLGLVHMDLGEGQTEFLHLEYAEGDKLYVPVAQLHLISRYSGAQPELVQLHKLGSGQWDKA